MTNKKTKDMKTLLIAFDEAGIADAMPKNP